MWINSVNSRRSQRPAAGLKTRAGLIALGLAAVFAGCGAANAGNDRGSTDSPARPTAAQPSARSQCPTGDALIGQARQLEKHGGAAAIRRWTRAIQAGPGHTVAGQASETGCASFHVLSDRQTQDYVDVVYNGRPGMAPALVLRQTPAAQRAILRAYRKNPDAVTSNPGLAGAVAMAEIHQGKNYQSAYRDLAFAALNGGIAPSYVRGYLAHFGCGYEDAVWAVKTKQSTDFLKGDAFPHSTTSTDAGRSGLINDRMALLRHATVPALRAGCPLSATYAAEHNGDALIRMKLKAKELKDRWGAKLGEFADKLTSEDDSSASPGDKDSATDDIKRQMVDSFARIEGLTRQAGELADERWDECSDRVDSGFKALIGCIKGDTPENKTDK